MTAYLFPDLGGWMLKVGNAGIYVDTKEDGIALCRALAPEHGIKTLVIAETNNGFIDEQ